MEHDLGMNVSDATSIVDAIEKKREAAAIQERQHQQRVIDRHTVQMELQEQRTQLCAYLVSRMKAGDMHAVQDAASDIREIDAKLELLKELYG